MASLALARAGSLTHGHGALQVGYLRSRMCAGCSSGIATAEPAAAGADPVDLTGPEATAGLVNFVEQARALAFSQRNQFLKDGLTPSVEGGQLLSPSKQLLIDDTKWALERSLRILLGKTPI